MRKIHNVQKLDFINDRMKIRVDGKEHMVALSKISKKLLRASKQEREKYEVSPGGYGIHWPLIDEDLSVDALLGIKHSAKELSSRQL